MPRFLLLLLVLFSTPLPAQEPGESPALFGRLENDGRTYLSPTGSFRVTVPVLPELGGRILDTENVVTFQDSFNVLCTIAAFPMDATQRWEHSTRGLKDYLAYFFANYVMPDFEETFPGARVETAKFANSIGDGALLTYMLLPGGSMFAQKLAVFGVDATPPVAKRGNLLVVRNGWIYVLSIELAERVLQRSSYTKTPDEEEAILRQRLVDLLAKVQFIPPAQSQ